MVDGARQDNTVKYPHKAGRYLKVYDIIFSMPDVIKLTAYRKEIME
jgi:hypothetical protein